MRSLLVLLIISALTGCSDDLKAGDDKRNPVPVDADEDGFFEDEDCDDENAEIFPGAEERCDFVDNDCDGEIDEESVDALTFYADADEDTYGDPNISEMHCEVPEGFVEDNTDCDDAAPTVNPGAVEVCDPDNVDEDCDGRDDDEDDSVDESTKVLFYRDGDTDGYGDVNDMGLLYCDPPVMTPVSLTQDDCNDTDPNIHPGAKEVCDDWNTDENCNGLADDEDAEVDAETHFVFYKDADGDGYGAADDAGMGYCDNPSTEGAFFSENNLDCEDENELVHPGMDELCDGLDNDCDSTTGEAGVITLVDPASGAKSNYPYTGTLSAPMSLITAMDVDLNICDGTYYLALEFAHDSVVRGLSGDPEKVIVSGGDLDATVLNVKTDGIDVEVSGVTLKDGVGSGGYDSGAGVAGGGVYCNANSDLTLKNAILRDNQAYFGGAIASVDCDLSLDSVSIHSNESKTDGTANGLGAGLFATSGTVTVENSIVYDNIGGMVGVIAMPAWDGDLSVEMTDVEIYENESPDESVFGSVYFEGDSTVTVDVSLDDVLIESNTAPNLTGGHTGLHAYGEMTLDWVGTTKTESGAYDNVVTGLIVSQDVSFRADTVDFGEPGTPEDNESSDVFASDGVGGTGIYWVGDDRSFVCEGGFCGDDGDGDGDPSNDADVYTLGDPSSASTSDLTGQYRGVIVQVTEHTTLESFDAYLGAGSTCTVDFYLMGALDTDADGRSDDEDWSVWWSSKGHVGSATGTSAVWQNSGRIGSFIAPQYEDASGVLRDTYVALGYGWDCSGSDTAVYAYDFASSSDVGIGDCIGYQSDLNYDTNGPYSSTWLISFSNIYDGYSSSPFVYLVRANVTEL